MTNITINLKVKPIGRDEIYPVSSASTSEEGKKLVAATVEIMTLGNYSEVQMVELFGAIRSTPTGIGYTQAINGVRNRIVEGWTFQNILDWLQGKESDRIPPSIQAAFNK